jgi:hypothetical protein
MVLVFGQICGLDDMHLLFFGEQNFRADLFFNRKAKAD